MCKYKEVRRNVYVLSLDSHTEVAEALEAFCAPVGVNLRRRPDS